MSRPIPTPAPRGLVGLDGNPINVPGDDVSFRRQIAGLREAVGKLTEDLNKLLFERNNLLVLLGGTLHSLGRDPENPIVLGDPDLAPMTERRWLLDIKADPGKKEVRLNWVENPEFKAVEAPAPAAAPERRDPPTPTADEPLASCGLTAEG